MPATQFSTPDEAANKGLLLAYFRERGQEALAELQREIGARNSKELAAAINQAFKHSIRQVADSISRGASTGNWSPEQKVSALLAATYSGQVAMLELRNEIRPYEYMDFSRRMGELWEDFITIVFDHAPASLGYFVPPLFSEVRTRLRQEITDYINALTLSAAEKGRVARLLRQGLGVGRLRRDQPRARSPLCRPWGAGQYRSQEWLRFQ